MQIRTSVWDSRHREMGELVPIQGDGGGTETELVLSPSLQCPETPPKWR